MHGGDWLALNLNGMGVAVVGATVDADHCWWILSFIGVTTDPSWLGSQLSQVMGNFTVLRSSNFSKYSIATRLHITL